MLIPRESRETDSPESSSVITWCALSAVYRLRPRGVRDTTMIGEKMSLVKLESWYSESTTLT